jgi:hypothetical protein
MKWRSTILLVLSTSLLLELCLQAFYYRNAKQFLFARVDVPLYVSEQYAGFAVKPYLSLQHNTNEFKCRYHTNSKGFRVSEGGEEYAVPKPPSLYRIMLLGPSFAFGWGVNYSDSFSNHLRLMLQENGFAKGKTIEFINAGVPAMPFGNQLNWYKHEGRQFKPDLLIQFTYGSMVVGSHDVNPALAVADGYLVNKRAGAATRVISRLKRSALVFYSWIAYIDIESVLWPRASGGRVLGAGRELTIDTHFAANLSDVADGVIAYDELRAVAEADGSRLLVVYIPLSYCVHPEDVSRWRTLGVTDVPGQIRFNKSFCEYLDARGVECLDITDGSIVEAQRSHQRLYYRIDVHWTPLGNVVAARLVSHHLLSADGRKGGLPEQVASPRSGSRR